MKCNGCWNEVEPKAQCVATHCGHLFCLKCAQSILESDESACLICENILTKSNVKLVNVLQSSNAYQMPETAMTAALASVNFYVGQLELQAQLRESQLQQKINKVQEACKRKLQEVHNGYTQAKRKYLEVLQEKQNLDADRAELQQKYAQKAQQARKLQEMFSKVQQEKELLQSARRGGIALREDAGQAFTSSAAGMGVRERDGPNMVTTIHRKQVFLGPEQHRLNARLMTGSQQHFGGPLNMAIGHGPGSRSRSATPPQRSVGSGGGMPPGRGALTGAAPLSPLEGGRLGGSGGLRPLNNAGSFTPPGAAQGNPVQNFLGGAYAMTSQRKPAFLRGGASSSPTGLTGF